MKKAIFVVLALILASCGSNQSAGVPTESSDGLTVSAADTGDRTVTAESILSSMETSPYRDGELMVKFRPGVVKTASASVHQAAGAQVAKTFDIVPGLQLVTLPGDLSVSDAIIQYMSDPGVEYAEPNFQYRPHQMVIPNDEYFGNLYGLHNEGTYAAGIYDADIDAPEAWSITTGSRDVAVAVLDTGVDYDHSDLVGNIWTNPGEMNCIDDIDNDGNGYIDDCRGWNFLDDTNDPIDADGHGTHVSGTLGATGNNGHGITGVMWRVSIMALKACCDEFGSFPEDAIVDGIGYAVKNGAKVINASFGGTGYSQAIFDAVRAARDAGVILVASAGNGSPDGLGGFDGVGDNNDLFPQYPASYDLSNIIAVAATDQTDSRVSFSNYGPISVDVAAPGVYTFSTVPNWWTEFFGFGVLEFFAGTSMSAPHVSGLAGLLYSYYDGVQNTAFDRYQVRDTILRYGDPLPTLDGWIATGKRINAYKALSSLLTPSGLSAEASSPGSQFLFEEVTHDPGITLTWTDNATGEDGYKIERRIPGGTFAEIADVPAANGEVMVSSSHNEVTYTDAGLSSDTTYEYRVKAYNNIAESFYSLAASASTDGDSGGGGGGCSIVAGEKAPVDVLIILIPLAALFLSAFRRKSKR